MEEDVILKDLGRTEEVQTIIDRMPANFGIRITLLVFTFIIFLAVFGWVIKYPDIVTGQIIINANNSPIKLIANTSGRLWINGFHSKDSVNEGDYVAIIQNAANLNDILKVNKLIKGFNINAFNNKNNLSMFPRDVSLGELNEKYFSFINAYEQYINYYEENLFMKQEEIQKELLIQQQSILSVSGNRLVMSRENMQLTEKSYRRDSMLFYDKVISEADLEKAKINFLSIKDTYNSLLNDITSVKEQVQETANKLQQIAIQKNEKEKQIRLDLISSYTDLADNFKNWEQKYVFKSPIRGKVQFLKFWSNDQYVQEGDPVFTIVPQKSRIIGQMTLPALGAGKVKTGQEVIIKLENYPYMEYGTIKGRVSSISLTTNPTRTEKGDIEAYLVSVNLPDGLKTNYGSQLDFHFELKGSGEIITKNRRVGERLFDNLRYIQKQ